MDNKILEKSKKELIAKKNVVGVGEGNKFVGGKETTREAVIVFVSKKLKTKKGIKELKDTDNFIPESVDGVETDVIDVGGDFYSQNTNKHRPMLGGVSGGHYSIGAGTINGLYFNNKVSIVTNNHVGANCNDALLGDPIWQPGRMDRGTPEDVIGYLEGFVPLKFSDESTCPIANAIVDVSNKIADIIHSDTRIPRPVSVGVNKVDLAWASVAGGCVVLTDILGIGKPLGYCSLDVGDDVKKSGRTSGVTEGRVLAVRTRTVVNFGFGRVCEFDNQTVTTNISEPGDSGSFVLNNHNYLGGMLFAGSNLATLVNTIDDILDELNS